MRPILVVALAGLAGCGGGSDRSATDQVPPGPTAVLSGSVPALDDGAQWVRPAKDYASTRFSPLDQITNDSVGRLGVKVTFSTGYTRGHEAAPLVVNHTMYVVTPFPNVLYALDL